MNLSSKDFLKAEWAEYRRPWKIFTFTLGLGFLFWGAVTNQAPDWDVPICLIMGIPTYFTAPISVRIILERRWKLLPVAALSTWVSVDGLYWLYWHFKNVQVLHAMRSANFLLSLSVYAFCGMFWLSHGTIREIFIQIATEWKSRQ